jgi:hypothetical protein
MRSVFSTPGFLLRLLACRLLCDTQTGSHPRSSTELIQLANDHSPLLQQAIEDTYPAKAIELGRVWSGHLHDFFFAVRALARPTIFIDNQSGPAMESIHGSDLWYVTLKIEQVGTLHNFHYQLAGKDFGGNLNMPAFGELSYPMPGVTRGIHQRKILFMIYVFVNPGTMGDSVANPTLDFIRNYGERTRRTLDDAMRSVLYDTVSDRYPHLLQDELLPMLAAQYNLCKDAYSHAIAGFSSGESVPLTPHGSFHKCLAGFFPGSAASRAFSGKYLRQSQMEVKTIPIKSCRNSTAISGSGYRMAQTTSSWTSTAVGHSTMFDWQMPSSSRTTISTSASAGVGMAPSR